MDDGVRETHGCGCGKVTVGGIKPSALVVWEDDNDIVVKQTAYEHVLTVAQARYLARKLYRLAARIEKRNG